MYVSIYKCLHTYLFNEILVYLTTSSRVHIHTNSYNILPCIKRHVEYLEINEVIRFFMGILYTFLNIILYYYLNVPISIFIRLNLK